MTGSASAPQTGPPEWSRPPGGLLVWIFIVLELATFAMAFGAYLHTRASAIELFNQSQALLNRRLALANTLVLLSSGFLVAQAVHDHARQRRAAAEWKQWVASTFGLLFTALKVFEYREKFALGLTMEVNDFFAFYWGLTGFHLLHVIIGTAFLALSALHLRRGKDFAEEDAGLETAGMFWHMCDLIWIVLFPLVYIIH